MSAADITVKSGHRGYSQASHHAEDAPSKPHIHANVREGERQLFGDRALRGIGFGIKTKLHEISQTTSNRIVTLFVFVIIGHPILSKSHHCQRWERNSSAKLGHDFSAELLSVTKR